MKLPAFKRIRIRRTYFICFAIIVTFNIGFVGSFLLVGYNGEGTTVKVASCPLITGGKCPDTRVTFYLYTPLNPTLPEKIEYTEKSSNLLQLNFNTSLPTKIFTHGYNSGKFIFDHLRREYLERGDYNIILQDWADLVPSPCYFTAAHNTRFAGRCLAEMVRRVWATGATDVHLVGFSLGAHVPAFAANDLRPLRLPRITGLDPAMPLFVTSNLDEKLDASDAHFVDVVHTNALAQGKVEQCGHIDFYMNGGITQPGCYGESGCNHHRSLAYFAESVRSEAGFWGWPCGGVMHYILGLCPPRGTPWKMGEDVDQRGQGFYVVRTNSAAPFARGPWQVAPTEFTRTGLRFLRSPWAPFRRR